MNHLPAIDGLRAVAVLAVVAYHAGLPVPAGFVGVDVFFVISGYLITRLLADEIRDTGRIDFMHFYARRARRILPAAVLVVGVTLALSLLLPSGRAEVARSAAAAAVFVANLHFQGVTGDYWADATEQMPLLHLWSLSVEEQFYLLWPLLLLAVRKAPLRWLGGVAVASFVLAEVLLWFNPTAAFYQMPARAWELALGGLVALRPVTLPRWSAGAGLAMVLLACFVPLPHFPGIGALPAVAGSALLIAAIHNGQSVRVLELRPVVYVGLISYSLYLWHWPLLAMDRASRVGDAPPSVRLALCAVAFVLAALSYRYVEQPFRRMQARPGRAVAAGVATALLVGCVGLAGASMRAKPAPEVAYQPCPPFNPDAPQPRSPNCPLSGPRVVVMGDSTSFAWQPVAATIANEKRIPVVVMSRDGCPVATGRFPLRNPRESRNCALHNAERMAYVTRHRPEAVVLTSRWQWLLDHNPGLDNGAFRMVEAMAAISRVVVIGPTPEMRDDPAKCAALRADCGVTLKEHLAHSAGAQALMARLAAIPNVQVIDATPLLCADGACPATMDGESLYSDSYHVRHATAARLTPLMQTL